MLPEVELTHLASFTGMQMFLGQPEPRLISFMQLLMAISSIYLNDNIFFGEDKMISVLYIGQYTTSGKFVTTQWKYFMEWCKTECNKIIIYSQMSYDYIYSEMPLYCKIKESNKPDVSLEIHAYEIHITSARFWDYVKEYNYNIDTSDNISHMFFFHEKRMIASLEIVDYENYILIEEPVSQEEKFLLHRELILENIWRCDKGKSDIDDLLQEDNWKPLGKASPAHCR